MLMSKQLLDLYLMTVDTVDLESYTVADLWCVAAEVKLFLVVVLQFLEISKGPSTDFSVFHQNPQFLDL